LEPGGVSVNSFEGESLGRFLNLLVNAKEARARRSLFMALLLENQHHAITPASWAEASKGLKGDRQHYLILIIESNL
jgi:hypothetical protein